MRAAVFERYGNAEVLEVVDHMATPTPAPNQVLVHIKAAGINPLDCRIRSGEPRAFIKTRFPMIPGHDGAGIVVATGNDVTQFKVGDHVFGLFDANPRLSLKGFAKPGTCAEFAVTREDTLALVPKGVDFIEAAATPLAALTAYQTFTNKVSLEPEQHILINGASGGVGSFAVQIAKNMGAHVTAICSGSNVERVSALGADRVIDYQTQDIESLSGDYDVFYDVVVNQSARKVRHLLGRNRGIYVSNVATASTLVSSALDPLRAPRNIKNRNQHAWVMPSGNDMTHIAKMIENDQLHAQIDQVYSLNDISKAHRHCESHHVKGKLVISMA